MPALEIIGAPQSNYVWVVRMVCAEKGVPYELNPVRPHSPDVDAIHPFGKIPVMRHGDVTLCESKAIATYIDRVFDGPKVIPEDPARAALVEQWVSLGNVEFDKLMMRQYVVGYAFPKEPGKPDMKAIGVYTTTSAMVIASAAVPISLRPLNAACQGVSPICTWR